MKYLNDLYHVIWKDGKLIEPQPEPTEEEKKDAKEEALEKMLDFLPCMCYFGSLHVLLWFIVCVTLVHFQI